MEWQRLVDYFEDILTTCDLTAGKKPSANRRVDATALL